MKLSCLALTSFLSTSAVAAAVAASSPIHRTTNEEDEEETTTTLAKKVTSTLLSSHQERSQAPPHPFSQVKTTETYKKLQLRVEPTKLRNDNPVEGSDDATLEECEPAITNEDLELLLKKRKEAADEKKESDTKYKNKTNLDSGFLSASSASSCSSKNSICIQNQQQQQQQNESSSTTMKGICMDKFQLYQSTGFSNSLIHDYHNENAKPEDAEVEANQYSSSAYSSNIIHDTKMNGEQEEEEVIYDSSAVAAAAYHSFEGVDASYYPSKEHGEEGTNIVGSDDIGHHPHRVLQTDCASYCAAYGSRPVVEDKAYAMYYIVRNCLYPSSSYICPDEFKDVPLNCWDVSKVKDFSFAFYYPLYLPNNFNDPLDCWDTGEATDMRSALEYLEEFNQPINTWKTDKVTDFRNMFYSVPKFNNDINDWNTKSAVSMYRMFKFASNFNQPLDNWKMNNVVDIGQMFQSASDFNQPLDNWNVQKVTSLTKTFYGGTSFNQPLNDWKTKNVVEMGYTFGFAEDFNQPLNDWITSKVEFMNTTFGYTYYFNQPLDKWDTKNVLNMRSMFYKSHFNQPIGSWDVSQVTRMDYMLFQSGAPYDSDNVPINPVRSPFDQCLLSWADQVPTDVNVTKMLYGTGCADTGPVAGEAPWCQTVEEGCDPFTTSAPTITPPDQCENDPDAEFGNKNQNCKKYLKKKASNKCKKKAVKEACPVSCPGPIKQLCLCKDAGKVKISKKKTIKCKAVKKNGVDRCEDRDFKFKVPIKELCPKTCNNKEACLK